MAIWDELHNDFKGYITEIKSTYWKALGLPFGDSGERVPGDIFFAQNDVIMYYAVDAKREYIEAGCVLPQSEGNQTFQAFCERIKDAMLPGYKDREPLWRPFNEQNPTFELVREEAQGFTPSPEQLNGATALSDHYRRHLLRMILGQRNCLLENLANGKPLIEVGQEVQALEGLGLVQKDFVVFCREAGNQISRVSSYNQIEEATRRGFKCFSCGRPIAEERIDQLLAVTPEGNLLARPNYWLGLMLSKGLEKLGIPPTQQLVVSTPDNAVLDLFTNYDGILLMFEIKEEAVHLDDVFLFFSRLSYYRPNLAFYLTTNTVSKEVRSYLSQEHETPVMLFEGIGGFEDQVKAVIQRCQRERMRDVVDRLEPFTRVDVGSLVYEHFFGREEKVREVVDEHPAVSPMSEEPQPMPAAAEFDDGKVMDGYSTPMPTAAEQAPVSERPGSLPSIPGLPTSGMSNMSGLTGMPAMPPLDLPSLDAMPPAPASTPSLPSLQGMPSLQPPISDGLPPLTQPDLSSPDLSAMADAGVTPVEAFPDIDSVPFGDMSEGMMSEEIMLEPIIEPLEEVLDMPAETSVLEKPLDEDREAVLRRVADDITANGVLGRGEKLDELLAEITGLSDTSAGLVDENGLLIADALSQKVPPDLLAALTVEINDNVQRGLDELGSPRATKITIEGAGDRLQIRPTTETVLLVVREERASHHAEEESAGVLPGEMVLREAMLKKVLEDLSMVEGVRGTIVAGRDGLLIESYLETEDVPPDVLSVVISQMIVDNEKNLQRLLLAPTRQMSVRTSEDLISLIPLDKEGILISILDPFTPREVWQNRLFAAANMLTSVFQ
jgi:predicted regulator of Ras-like GTPase activity (Roadblock/LC7/MglB family)